MGDDNQAAGKTDTGNEEPSPSNGQPPTTAHEPVAPSNPPQSKQGISWDRWIELFFTFAIVAATVVNVSIANFQWAAMVDSNGINQKGYSAQARAFVLSNSIQFINYGAKGSSPEETPRWAVSPIIENSGNTPTRYLKFSVDLVFNGEVTAEAFERRDPYKLPFSKGVIGPRSELASAIFMIGPVNMSPIQDRKLPIGALGVIKYRDVFGDWHLTEYCYAGLVPRFNVTDYPIGQPIRVWGAFCEKHNCSDDECGPNWKERAQD